MDIIRLVLTNVLTALYQPFSFAVLLAVLFMFLYLYADEKGWKNVCLKWLNTFKNESSFRRIFLLAFCTAIILFRTLLNRNMWANPLSKVMDGWGLYNKDGKLTTEAIENVLLFIPFIFLLLWAFKDKIINKVKLGIVIWKAVYIAFTFSLTIEFLQLLLRLGTFQLSDLFYNTIGGFVGGVIYYVCYKLKKLRPPHL